MSKEDIDAIKRGAEAFNRRDLDYRCPRCGGPHPVDRCDADRAA